MNVGFESIKDMTVGEVQEMAEKYNLFPLKINCKEKKDENFAEVLVESLQ